MRRFFSFFLILLSVASAAGQPVAAGFDLSNYGVRIEPDKRVMVVLATLEMAKDAEGQKLINTPLSEKGAAFRARLASDNAALNEDLRRRISAFVAQHKKRNSRLSDADLIAPFISMAYALTPVPELADPVITSDLPGSLLDVLDFAPLVREFYRRSSISSKLDEYAAATVAEADGVLRTSAREMVSELLDYLHTRPRTTFIERVRTETKKTGSKKQAIAKVETREHERRFFIVPERLAAENNINFLNIRDDYYVIVPPDTDLSLSEARRAFLQFVVDPLVLGNAKEINVIRDWAKPILEERRKSDPSISPDIFRMTARSLVAAIDVRQTEHLRSRIATEQARNRIGTLKTDSEKKKLSEDLERFKQGLADESALRLYEDYEKGAILSFYFADQLKGIEDSGFDIASSLREMIASFDAAKEANRVAAAAEAKKRALAARELRKKAPDSVLVAVENPVTLRLVEIQKSIDARNYAKADSDLQQLLAANPTEARIHYSLGRVASLEAVAIEDAEAQAAKLLDAKKHYENVLKTGTSDRALLSLTYVALGRIYEHHNNNAYAIRLYDEAIKLSDVAGGGFREALAAKQRLLKPQ